MALRDLVEGECGGANSLVRLTSHLVQDRGLKEEGFRGLGHGEGFSGSDPLVQQFFEETLNQASPTFRMDSLLAEMRDLERGMGAGPPVQSAPIAQLAAEHDVSCWAEQYLDAGKQFQETKEDTTWGVLQSANSASGDTFELGFGPNWAQEYLQSTSEQLLLDEPEAAFTDLGASEEYSTETNKDELKETASKILNQTADDLQFNYSKFMKFMHQIGEGEVTIENGKVIGNSSSELATSWLKDLNEYKQEILDEKWSEVTSEETQKDSEKSQNNLSSEFISDMGLLNSEAIGKEDENLNFHPWTQDYNDFIDLTSTFNKYNFEEENPMAEVEDAMAEGKRRMAAGDIPSAVLCFEAAVNKQPDNIEAWQLLGLTQQENEQDSQAIAALKKCLELDPGNLSALMGLAVSYTNENFDPQACHTLKDWLKANPKYSDLVPETNSMGTETLSTVDLHKDVCERFIAAARRNPINIDVDVQCGLGVLFNLTNEQDKAVDCFKSALQVRPKDFTMWNRLGATLANGGRPEEAVDAYHNALQLYPGFIRARYNLGITCTHLGAHRSAVQHFLSALNQQAAGRGLQGKRSAAMSDTIWTTLRLVVSFLDRQELTQAVLDRDLVKLNKEFIETGDHLS